MGVRRGSLGTRGEEEATQEESTTVGVAAEPGVGDSVGLVEGRAPGRGRGRGRERMQAIAKNSMTKTL